MVVDPARELCSNDGTDQDASWRLGCSGQDHIMLDFDWGRVTKIVCLWPSFDCCCLCLLILLNMFDFVVLFLGLLLFVIKSSLAI